VRDSREVAEGDEACSDCSEATVAKPLVERKEEARMDRCKFLAGNEAAVLLAANIVAGAVVEVDEVVVGSINKAVGGMSNGYM
jgi:hypothetical protein